tara:strand:+ start:329 stop:664 length:336 start_codon:yes stop_codon:yes gene_type:complete
MAETDEEYAKELEEMERLFPDAKFEVTICLNELNDIVTSKKKITIQHTYTCYCYGDDPLPTKYFIIEGDKLTNKYIIDELIKQGLTMNCNHIFLEGFNELHDNMYEIMVGS